MIKFIDWWFTEIFNVQYGLIVFFTYLILIRTILLKYIDINYMYLDGMVFPIFLAITMIGPELKRMQAERE